jgi:outer membrane protein OmpA-like peptidoglycan-associated protein
MQFKGYGFSKPVSSNETAEGRTLNRRTEFVIIKK